MTNEINKVYNNIIYKDKKLEEMFKYINNKKTNRGLEWYLEYNQVEKKCFGSTKYDKNEDAKYIFINIFSNHIMEKSGNCNEKYRNLEKAVIIHELGEADYILSNLPTIMVEKYSEMNDTIREDLSVIISHYHINELIKKYGLDEFINSQLTYKRNLKDYLSILKPWEIIIEVCWALVTYPKFNYEVAELGLDLDASIIQAIDKIIKIIKNLDTFETKNIAIVEIEFAKIIGILNEYGMEYKVNIISRR